MTEIDDLAAIVRAGLDVEGDLAQRLADRYVYKEGGMMRPEFWGQRFWPSSHVRAVFRDLAIRDTQGKDTIFVEGLHLIEAFSPWRVLAEVASKRALLDALLAEPHASDCWTQTPTPGPCDCGRDERVLRYLQLLAQPYQETT